MSLHDIPLAVEEQGDTVNKNSERISKTNSLRRFFKLPNKKNLEAMEKDNKDADVEAGEAKTKEQQKRFHLRMGGSSAKTNSESVVVDREPAMGTLSQASTSTASRPTLRGSISNYWNTVFKRHNAKRGSSPSSLTVGSGIEEGGNSSDEDLTKSAEDVHTLPLSDEDVTASQVAAPVVPPVAVPSSASTPSPTGTPKPVSRPNSARTPSPNSGAKGRK